MSLTKVWKPIIILMHALVLWALCGAVMFLGRELFSMKAALIIHLLVAPVISYLISLLYFKKFNYTTPLQTAIIFVSVVILMDFFIVALLIEKSFEMFASVIGTWGPFALIFMAAYLTGITVKKRS
ncbi:MAG: hypothetical protein GTO17_02780 [Candidatus Aminicenantes bacterium]|nr:hypothetical protein [Candidatus Aminicenantes bacterium]